MSFWGDRPFKIRFSSSAESATNLVAARGRRTRVGAKGVQNPLCPREESTCEPDFAKAQYELAHVSSPAAKRRPDRGSSRSVGSAKAARSRRAAE